MYKKSAGKVEVRHVVQRENGAEICVHLIVKDRNHQSRF